MCNIITLTITHVLALLTGFVVCLALLRSTYPDLYTQLRQRVFNDDKPDSRDP